MATEAKKKDDTLVPGGPHAAKAAVGMTELDRETVPNGATDPHQTDYGSPPLLEDDGSDRDQV